MTSPLDPLALLPDADQPARALVYVDEANFAKLCEHPNAQRLIHNGVLYVDLDGVTYRHADSLPGPDDDDDLDTGAAFARSPLDILTAAALNAADRALADADTFAKLCERPRAQRYIVDGTVQGVLVDGVAYQLTSP